MVLRPVLIYVAAGKELAASSPGTTVTEDISALESTDQSLGRGEQKVLMAQASSHRQVGCFLQFHSSFSRSLWLFEVFCFSIQIVKLFVLAL